VEKCLQGLWAAFAYIVVSQWVIVTTDMGTLMGLGHELTPKKGDPLQEEGERVLELNQHSIMISIIVCFSVFEILISSK
jgi:hypothetical protein